MGNRNRGKSFLLQALSGGKLITGSTINTKGLSIKFSENKFILLDSAGSESPILGRNQEILDIVRDKLFTESFLQNYIMKYSNVLLLVVGCLTLSEQKLIKRIHIKLNKLNKNKKSRNLIVIHNLMTYETKAQVEYYINNVLMQSSSFNLAFDKSNFSDNVVYFYDKDDQTVKTFYLCKRIF